TYLWHSAKPNLTVRPVPEADADHGVYRPTIRYILKLPDYSFHKAMGIQMQQSYKPGLIK
ncbi:hypothetical protein, partial [Salmonella enterica]|uniref:hypothetical protein n=1 Tax=Salmonella enterica TaxID=28901 RepID=UPI001C7F1D49